MIIRLIQCRAVFVPVIKWNFREKGRFAQKFIFVKAEFLRNDKNGGFRRIAAYPPFLLFPREHYAGVGTEGGDLADK